MLGLFHDCAFVVFECVLWLKSTDTLDGVVIKVDFHLERNYKPTQ